MAATVRDTEQRDDVQPVANENLDRFLTGTVTVLPILALGLVAWQVWSELLGWSDLIVFAIMYIATGLGITVGFHRLFTHRAFKTGKAVRAVLAALGSAAIEGPVISWVADHRKHHAYSDKPGDPHSPHVDHGHGLRGALRGLFHAHVGWLFIHTERGLKTRYAPDLIADPVVSFINRTFVLWVFAGLAAPFLLGWLIGGTMHLALDLVFNGRQTPRSIVAFYSFAYRAGHRFEAARLLGNEPRPPVDFRFWRAFFGAKDPASAVLDSTADHASPRRRG